MHEAQISRLETKINQLEAQISQIEASALVSEARGGLGRPERTSLRPCRASQGKTDGQTHVLKLPSESYRTSSPSGPLPCIKYDKV